MAGHPHCDQNGAASRWQGHFRFDVGIIAVKISLSTACELDQCLITPISGGSVHTTIVNSVFEEFQILDEAEAVVLPRLRPSCSLPSSPFKSLRGYSTTHELQTFPASAMLYTIRLVVICRPIGSLYYVSMRTWTKSKCFHENTPKPLANQVKDMTVMAAVIKTTPKTCFSWTENAPLQVAHLNSFRGVYACPVYMPKTYWS